MKKKLRSLYALLFALFIPLSACNTAITSSDGEAISLSENYLVLDMYQEYDLVVSGFEGTLAWSSSNPEIVTVDQNGHLSCQGLVGDVVIEVKAGNLSAKCTVSVKNQLINPNLAVTDMTGFLDYSVKPNVRVRYVDQYYYIADYTLTSEDTDIAYIEGDSIVGKLEGEARIAVNAVWKKKQLATRYFFITILPGKTIVLDQTEFDIYSVDTSALVKENNVTVDGTVYIGGEASKATLAVSLPDTPYLEVTNNMISIKEPYMGEEPLKVNAEVYVKDEPTIRRAITINVHANFLAKKAFEEVKETYLAEINLTNVDFDNRTDVLKYEIPNKPINQNKANPTWTDWNTRVEFFETMTKNGVVALDSMVESGYTLLSFDLYYTGTKGILIGAYGAGAKDYFYNEVQVNRSDILLVNSEGIATNTLKKDQWFTAYIKIADVVLASMTTGQSSAALYLAPCFVNDVTYIDNVRYYYDYAPLGEIDYALDLETRDFMIDENNPNKATVIDEFVVYSPNYVAFDKNKGEGLSTYDSSNAQAMDREQRSKITPSNLVSGRAMKEGYRYLAFTYKYISGNPILYYFDLYQQKNVSFVLTPATINSSNKLHIYHQGKKVDRVVQNEEVTIVVQIDGKSSETMYLTSAISTKFMIGDYAYYKDESFHHDYGVLDPLMVIPTNIDLAFVEESYDIRNLLTVIYDGKPITDYQLIDLSSTSPHVTLTGDTIHFTGKGEITIDFKVKKDSFEEGVSLTTTVYDETYLHVFEKEVELYAGPRDYFAKTHDILAQGFINKVKVDIHDMSLSIVNNNGVISLNGNKITALKEGTAQVKVTIGTEGNEISDYVDIVVFEDYRTGRFIRSVNDATNPASYTQVNETIFGVENPWLYNAPVASWNNKLDVELTAHTDTNAYKNIRDQHLQYVTFYMLLTPGTTGRLAMTDPNGSHTMLSLSAGNAISGTNANLIISKDGVTVTTLQANTWYKVVVDYSLFIQQYQKGYTCVEFGYVKGSIYLTHVRYYHENITL